MYLYKNKRTALAIVAFLIAFPILLSNNAFSHGDAPSTCENRYDATITSMTINNGTQTFDPVSNPDLQLAAQIDKGYDVTFILHTANSSSQNNTLSGTTWYRHSAFGFGNGVCVDNAGPDQNISVTVYVTPPSGIPDDYQQNNVQWGAWPEVVQLSYGVVWHSGQKQESHQNNTSTAQSIEEDNAAAEEEMEDSVPRNEEEFEDEYSGIILSPFIYKDKEETTVSATILSTDTDNETTMEQLSLSEDALHINGTLASYQFLNETSMMQLHLLSGNWSMAMNETAVVNFDADFTVMRSDGTSREEFSLGNLTAVNDSEMHLANDTISIKSTLDYHAYGETTRANATITVQRLNVIVIELKGMNTTPIYGVIDKIVLVQDGQMTVVKERQFDMI